VTEEVAGVLYVRPKKTYLIPEILEYEMTDTTPIVRNFRQKVVRSYVHRNIETFRTLRLRGILKKVCVTYKDPIINFDLVPVKTRNVVFHMFSFRITGDIVNSLHNKSKEGEEGKHVTWRWKSCPTDPDVYDWEKVKGSADIISNWLHNFTEDSTGTYLDEVRQSVSKKPPGAEVEVSASWEKGGLGPVIFTLLNIFLTGRVVLRNGYDVSVKYTWKDQTQTVNRHIDAKVALPVEGSVGVAWD